MFRMESEGHLQPIGFAQNLTHIEVYPEHKILLTDFEIRTFDGAPISKCAYGKTQIIPTQSPYKWIIGEMWGNDRFLVVMDDEKVLYSKHCRDIIHSDKYAVLTMQAADGSSICQVVRYDGSEVMQFAAAPVQLCGDFAIVGSISNYQLYSLKTGKLLQKNLQFVVPSAKHDFAIGCRLSGAAHIYYNGKWSKLGEVQEIGFISDRRCVFAVQRGGRYYLYHFSGEPHFATQPDGVENIYCNEHDGHILVLVDGKARFV